MTSTIYRLTTDAGVMYVSADLTQAAAPIYTYFGHDPHYQTRGESSDYDGGRWDSTPYQTATARHRESEMARLIADYCDMGGVRTVEAIRPVRIDVSGEGGTQWRVTVVMSDGGRIEADHPFLGAWLDHGEIDEHGQWQEGDSAIDDAAIEFARGALPDLDIPDDIDVRQ